MSTLFDLPFEEPDEPVEPLEVELPTRRVYSVAELTATIRTSLEERFFEVWVEGELSNCRVWNTGHLYFTIKDAAAQIRGVMFRSALRTLPFTPKDGQRVVARGRISVYDPKGEYQLVSEHLEPAGVGARQLALEQLKARLLAEGLFAAARKRALPELPRRVGVVTSLDGAAVRDIIQVLRRRYANVHIVIRPTRVQGEGAGLEIARAVTAIGKVPQVDVVIVGRGGGSAEDLWAFNEEVVARAIAGCPVPTVSAVGHETDVTIADFVADRRAPTPSAAAEMVLGRKEEVFVRIDRLTRRLAAAIDGRRSRLESRLRTLDSRPGFAGFSGRVAMRSRHVAELTGTLSEAVRRRLTAQGRSVSGLAARLQAMDVRHRLALMRRRLETSGTAMEVAMTTQRRRRRATLETAVARLEAMSPLAVLGRGYALCWSEDRTTVVRTAAQVRAGDRVRVRLASGELRCDVTASTPADRDPRSGA